MKFYALLLIISTTMASAAPTYTTVYFCNIPGTSFQREFRIFKDNSDNKLYSLLLPCDNCQTRPPWAVTHSEQGPKTIYSGQNFKLTIQINSNAKGKGYPSVLNIDAINNGKDVPATCFEW